MDCLFLYHSQTWKATDQNTFEIELFREKIGRPRAPDKALRETKTPQLLMFFFHFFFSFQIKNSMNLGRHVVFCT